MNEINSSRIQDNSDSDSHNKESKTIQDLAANHWTGGRASTKAEDDKKYDAANQYWQANQDRFLEELKADARIPSITAVPEYRADVRKAAEWDVAKLKSIGMENAKVIEGTGTEAPLVYADWLHAPGKPTILLYTHFDVQPVEPLDEWKSPPFEPEVRDGKLWGRGTADDKGQGYILMAALEGYLKTAGELPVNVKILFEGEEESSGPHIGRYVHENKDQLAADVAVVLDSGMFAPGMPTIDTGLRGLITAEITAHGANRNLHSGEFGGVAPNAMQSLSEILTALKKPDGTVNIPDFYKDVTPPDKAELDSWAKLPFDEKKFQEDIGVPALIGDPKYSVLYRTWALPTLDINGIKGSFVGGNFNTIIPSDATAQVSMRLVPDMDPQKTAKLFKDYVQKVAPADVHTEVKILGASAGMRIPTDNPFIQAAAQAFKTTFGKDTVYTRDGGSIEIANSFRSELGAAVLMTGFTLPDDNEHAPNENLDLGNFRQGIQAMGRYLEYTGQLNGKAAVTKQQ